MSFPALALTLPPSRTQISAWHRLTTLLLNAILVLVKAPPLGVPSAPLCLSENLPILTADTPGVSSLIVVLGGGFVLDSLTSRRMGSNGRDEGVESSSGTSRRRWVGMLVEDEEAGSGAADGLVREEVGKAESV